MTRMPTHQQRRRRPTRCRYNDEAAPAPPTPPRRTQTDIHAVVGGGDRSSLRYHRVEVNDDSHGWSSSCCGSSYNSDDDENDTLTLDETLTLDDGRHISPRRGTFLRRPKQHSSNRSGRSGSGGGAERCGCVQQIITEVSGAYEDTVTSLDQVCHAFTLTSKDIHAVTRKIYKAQRQYNHFE